MGTTRTFQDMLNEYLPNELLKEELIMRDYVLQNVQKDIEGSIHEKPLKAFLNERLNHFLNWQPAGDTNVD